MKNKIINIIIAVASVLFILANLIDMFMHYTIPALSPLSSTILIFWLMYTTKQDYDKGKRSKKFWLSALIIGSLVCALGIGIGIEQIITAMSN